FLRLNSVSTTTSLRSSIAKLPAAFAEAEAEGAAFLEQDLLDAGGIDDMPIRIRAQHAYRSELHVDIRKLSIALRMYGLFDRKGRARLEWLQRLESLINTARQLDATLGLERRARRIADMGADEWRASVTAKETT